MPKKILIIAGEASSDCHAALLVKAIKDIAPDTAFFGLGGIDMQGAGVNVLHNIVNMAVIGFVDVLKYYSQLKKIYEELCGIIKKDPPDCAILIDYPGFNLKIAKKLKALNIPVIYYISPQIWAWGFKRINKIKLLVDKMLVFFEFEKNIYEKAGVGVSFVGHPLLDTVKATEGRLKFLSRLGLDPKKITIGILPGSRNNEITRILPTMASSAKIINERLKPDRVQFLVAVAKTIDIGLIKNILGKTNLNIALVKGEAYNAINASDAVMVASGTATLETALLGVPMAIVYKVSLFTYLIVKPIIKIPYIGMVNVLAGEKIVPEFIQRGAKPKLIADYICRLAEDKNYSEEIKGKILQVKSKLGNPGAIHRAAKEITDFLQK